MQLTRRGALRSIGLTTIAATTGVGLASGSVAATPGNETTVRVVHASPDAPAVDVYWDGTAVLTDVPFRTASPFLSVDPGTHTVAVTAAGDPEAVVYESDLEIENDTDYTVTALGELGADTFEPLVSIDDRAPVTGIARVRVLHASPDAPAVDVTVNDGAATLLDDIAFGEITEEYVEAEPGTYDVEIRPETEDDDGDVVYETTLELMGDAVYTVFATGYVGEGSEMAPFELRVTDDTDPN